MDSPLSLLGSDLARLAALGGFGRLGKRIDRFLPDERLRRVFSFQALYAGVSPRDALGAYGVIAYMAWARRLISLCRPARSAVIGAPESDSSSVNSQLRMASSS